MAMKTKTDINSIDDDPDVIATATTFASIVKRLDEAAALSRKYEHLLSPATGEQVDELLRLEAMANFAPARLAVLKLEAAFVGADRASKGARDAARARVSESFVPRERAAVAELRTALRAAQKANKVLQNVQFARHTATSMPFEPLSFMELNDAPDGRIDLWNRRCAEYGYGE